ncbi:ribonuclease P protein component [Prevotella sp. P6B4]|uniref:ribonuclease P protein component n=1 Tax=Prevotella sp. P6B4 TaxID=1410614 RepID=UPI000490686F|nr:ribonuclease P protein component [Prevotella sp. P6B4]
MTTAPTFRKEERIVSNVLIESLFEKGNSQSQTAFPLKAVYLKTELREGCAPVQLLISVPKKRFKHAVDRNRIKRQVREAYRKNKSLLEGTIEEGQMLLIAIIWLTDKHFATKEVEKKIISILKQIAR